MFKQIIITILKGEKTYMINAKMKFGKTLAALGVTALCLSATNVDAQATNGVDAYRTLPSTHHILSGQTFATISDEEVTISNINNDYVHIWGDISIPARQEYVWQQLLADISVINSVSLENEERFAVENRIWIGEVNTHLENFFQTVPPEHQYDLAILLSGGNPSSRVGRMSDFFNFHELHWRGSFLTHTLRPSLTTRFLRPMAEHAWNTFYAHYDLTWRHGSNNVASIRDQYLCHFEFDFETLFFGGTWDLEVGRPNVGLWQTILALCNP